jgi:hypothetical protein
MAFGCRSFGEFNKGVGLVHFLAEIVRHIELLNRFALVCIPRRCRGRRWRTPIRAAVGLARRSITHPFQHGNRLKWKQTSGAGPLRVAHCRFDRAIELPQVARTRERLLPT